MGKIHDKPGYSGKCIGLVEILIYKEVVRH